VDRWIRGWGWLQVKTSQLHSSSTIGFVQLSCAKTETANPNGKAEKIAIDLMAFDTRL